MRSVRFKYKARSIRQGEWRDGIIEFGDREYDSFGTSEGAGTSFLANGVV